MPCVVFSTVVVTAPSREERERREGGRKISFRESFRVECLCVCVCVFWCIIRERVAHCRMMAVRGFRFRFKFI